MDTEAVVSETYFGKEIGGTAIKFDLQIMKPVPCASGGFACSIIGRTEIASQIFSEAPLTVTGLTVRRVLGEALLLSDSILELRGRSQGPWALERGGGTYDDALHGAVPRAVFDLQLGMRASYQDKVLSGIGDTFPSQPPGSTSEAAGSKSLES